MLPDPLTPADLAWIAPLAGLLALWHILAGVGLIAGRRVPPGLVFAPLALVLLVAAARVLWTSTTVPWDPRSVFALERLTLAAPDARVRLALPVLLGPALLASATTGAIAGPLRGPRTVWPAGIGALLGVLGLLAITTSSALDLAPLSGGTLLLALFPVALASCVALVRGDPAGSGPEAGVVATVALAHLAAAGAIGALAEARWAVVGELGYHPDPAAWRVVGFGVAWLAAVGCVAVAGIGATSDRARTLGVGIGVATLALWVPIALTGSLGRLS